ncbi:MAG TPA: LysM peptidoglycan-binding domain-containing protein [Isosphaeraceae bacterium]
MDQSTRTRFAVALLAAAWTGSAVAEDPAPPPGPPPFDPSPMIVRGRPEAAPPGRAAAEPLPRAAAPEANGVATPRLAHVPSGAGATQRPGAAGSGEVDRRIQVDKRGRLTLHMDDLDIRRALEILSRQGGLNIMIAPGVTGTVTANLEGVTIDEALAAILRLTNLTARREGGLIFVYSPQELKALAYRDQELETRIFRLNYVRANDVMGIVGELLSPDGTITATPPSREGISEAPSFSSTSGTGGGGGGGGGGAVAPSTSGGGGGGGISGPGGTGGNSMSGGDVVIIRDYTTNLKTIDAVIREIDVAPIQLLIEAVIITVDLEQNQSLGVNFAVVDNMAQSLGTIGNGSILAPNSGFTPAKLLTVPASATASAIAASGRLNGGVNPPGFNSATDGIKYGFVSKNVSGFINALETLGETRVLASPRILVLNKQKAEIQLGQRLGYPTITQNFTSTVQQIQFLNTGTLLRLRPFVSSDGMVRMEIHPERSTGSVPAPQFIPSQNTAEMTTNVMIPDGATLVIGGLMEDERDYNQQGLPGLNRLPILGAAFGNKAKTLGKRELVVLLTPHIWRPNLPPVPPPHGGIAPLAGAGGPGAPATAPAAGNAPPEGRHVVREGEDLWSIAKKHYGSGRYFQAIWDANRDRISSPESIPPGTELRMPAAELARSTAPAAPGQGPAPAPAAEPPASAMRPRTGPAPDPAVQRSSFEVEAPPGAQAPTYDAAVARAEATEAAPADGGGDIYPIHVVGRFESLRSIARDRLGDARRAPEILALNRNIFRSSDRPVPGQHLRLPRDATPLRHGR